jgi:nucleotide-binding universal stress UspA family protein
MGVAELHEPPIVVGVDGSPASLAALRWAHREASRVGARLDVVTVWPSHSPEPDGVRTVEQALDVAARAIAAEVPADWHEASVWVSPFAGRADETLLNHVRTATLLAVGPHSRHTVAEHLLGSVTEHLLARAAWPVAVIPAGEDATTAHRIVVGLDGSAASLAALHWAATRALATDSKVEALFALQFHPEYGFYPYGPTERQQRAAAESTLARATLTLPEPLRGLVHTDVVHGRAAKVLVAAGESSDLIVVGNNRLEHLASHLAGSVSRKVAMHARVPVVVTHAAAPGTS